MLMTGMPGELEERAAHIQAGVACPEQ